MRVVETQPERKELAVELLRGDRRNGRRIETTAQVRADRNVSAKPDSGRVDEQRLQLLEDVGLRSLFGNEINVPPSCFANDAIGPDHRVMSRRKLANSLEGRMVGQARPQREDVDDPYGVDLSRGRGVAEQRLPLRGKTDVAVVVGQKKRSHAESIAGEKELPPLAVPDGQREVAVEASEAARSPLLVRVGDDFGVRRRGEAMTEVAELVPQLEIVVDLAVLQRPEAPALVGERLVASFEIDDRQPCACDADPPVQQEPCSVRAAMA